MWQIVKVYKDWVWYQVLNTNNIWDALEAWDNISINWNEISAVDTTYSAWTWLSLSWTTFSLNINYWADLSLSIDPSTFVLTAQLKDQNWSNIWSAQTIDLPLESVVVSWTYNAQTKEVELTLQSGSVIRFSVADLVSWLQEELVVWNWINIDSNNEISVDTSVVATQTDLASKQDTLTAWTNIQIDTTTNTISSTDTKYSAWTWINIDANNVISSTVTPWQTYTAWNWINIDANNEISNTLPWPTISATAPTNPTEWQLWYDTTNDVLKAYNGTSWIEVWNESADINTKTFTITSTWGDPRAIAEAEEIYNWYLAGKNPIVRFSNMTFVLHSDDANATIFHPVIEFSTSNSVTTMEDWELVFVKDNGSILVVVYDWASKSYLDTYVDYQTPYTPLYNGSPATKKYVDDAVASITPWQTYTAWNWINISQNNEISADTTVVATKTDVNNKVSKWTNQINGQLFSIEDTYGNSANFWPDYVRIDFDDWTDSWSAGFQRGSLWASANGKMSNLTSDSLALRDNSNLTQTIYAEGGISVIDSWYWNLESFEFDWWWNNQIARLKDVKTYTAWNWINISQNNEISADTTVVATKTDLNTKQDTLTAWENTSIENICESDMQWPCPSGFHVPTVNEWNWLINIMKNALSLQYWPDWMGYLHMPLAWQRDCESSDVEYQREEGFYVTSIFDDATPSFSGAFFLLVRPGDTVYVEEYWLPVAIGLSIRWFKNEYITPTSSWTVVQWTLWSAWIFRDQTNWLISITDWTTGYTMMDKNLWATTVWNTWDTLSEANCGKYYQWWNNYWFPRSWSITTSSTQVDASWYWPWNYYSSSTFITTSTSPFDWSSVENKNLRWWVSQWTWCRLTISAEDTKYSAWTWINIDANNVISATATPWQTYTAWNWINISQNNEISADTTVVATKTDVGWMVSKWSNETDSILFSITNPDASPQTTTAFWPDWVICGNNNWLFLTSVEVNKVSVTDSLGKSSELWSNRLALYDSNNMAQTTFIENGITVNNTVGSISETYQFSWWWNNQIARLKDVKTYTAWNWINVNANNEISNTLPWPTIAATAPTGTEWALWYDTTNDVLMAHDWTAWKEAWTQMKVLSYGHSTWQDFLNAYNENAIVYCKASSNSNPWSWTQWRMAFMAFIDVNSSTQAVQGVEFQYYRSRSDHNSAANQLDEVYVYKLTSNWTWTVTQRNTAAKAVAWTWINLAFGSGNMTISADTTTLATKTDLNSKQDTLVSWTNIKTVNNESLLWTWNITIPIAEIWLSTATWNLLTLWAKIWVWDESDLPATQDSNTVYLCAEQTSWTPRLPAAYQEVEYIESWSDWQYIQFTLPYFGGWDYSIEIDVSNVWFAEWTLLTMNQSLN